MDHTLDLPAAPAHLAAAIDDGAAVAWEQDLTLGTYATGRPEGLPIFSESRVYQGSSGRVYPLPFIERIEREKLPRAWRAIHLENRWLRLVVLPELGGRIQIGYDKVAGYDFFYRNTVIKPALVGLAGPWISGGVEFNWPQHHRPATYLPVDAEIEHEVDGAVTVWCTDHDPFARMRASHGIRLRPDSSLIELRVRLHNRTEERQTFLWWANVAARSHERYQSFFPPDVHFVADHARRAVSAFPRADRPYYGVDYPARVDADHPDADRLDYYSNIPVPTSYMVLSTRDDFFGGYDHDAQAGFVHWADRRIAPGKKQWTWGNGAFGHAWDRQLTDGDGPYVELMAGVFTDNQPDFSYLAPGEVRDFEQFWYPISRIGVPLHATTDAALSVNVTDRAVDIGVATPRHHSGLRVVLHAPDGSEHESVGDAGPDAPLLLHWALPGLDVNSIVVEVIAEGRPLARWEPPSGSEALQEPEVATEPPAPRDIASNDELYITGVHLEQYRHPTRAPEPYWFEAIQRDPGDARSLVALASLEYRRGRYREAESLLRRATARLTRRNPNPPDTEAFYRLGLVLRRQGRDAEASDAFGRALWAHAWSDAARIELARAELRADCPEAALSAVEGLPASPLVAALRVIALRRLSDERAVSELDSARREDPLDRWLRSLDGIEEPARGRIDIDLATEYQRVGELVEAERMLRLAAEHTPDDAGAVRPIALYRLAVVLEDSGRPSEAAEARVAARSSDLERCFPAGLDDYDALVAALAADPADASALDLLGIWLYDAGRHAAALEAWEAAAEAGASRAVLTRNRAIATVVVRGDLEAASDLYDAALASDPWRARLLLERDALAIRRDESPADRLARLDAHAEAVDARDDLIVTRAELLCALGRAEEAVAVLLDHELRAWEGGEGLALAAWDHATLALAEQELAAGDAQAALRWVQRSLDVPLSLGEDRHMLSSLAHHRLIEGLASGKSTALLAGVADSADPIAHPQRPADEATYWVGCCAAALGDDVRAEACWAALEHRAEALEQAPERVDYFATSLPELTLFGQNPTAVGRRASGLRDLAAKGRARSAPGAM